MADPKNIRLLSKSEEEKRAAAFEAQALAELAKGPAPAAAAPEVTGARPEGIAIAVTNSGQTTRYPNLAAVPPAVRQRILNAWQPAAPPVLAPAVTRFEPPTPVQRPRSRRMAMGLNLMLPGAGQFYVGQPVAGTVYAVSFGACCVATLVIFLRGYSDYVRLSVGGDIFAADNLERLAQSSHTGWIIGLTGACLAIYLISAVHLSRTRVG